MSLTNIMKEGRNKAGFANSFTYSSSKVKVNLWCWRSVVILWVETVMRKGLHIDSKAWLRLCLLICVLGKQLFHLWTTIKLSICELLFIWMYFVNVLFLLKISIKLNLLDGVRCSEIYSCFFFPMAKHELIPKRTLFTFSNAINKR